MAGNQDVEDNVKVCQNMVMRHLTFYGDNRNGGTHLAMGMNQLGGRP